MCDVGEGRGEGARSSTLAFERTERPKGGSGEGGRGGELRCFICPTCHKLRGKYVNEVIDA